MGLKTIEKIDSFFNSTYEGIFLGIFVSLFFMELLLLIIMGFILNDFYGVITILSIGNNWWQISVINALFSIVFVGYVYFSGMLRKNKKKIKKK